ncbi:Fatty acid desaturase [Labilithrix luteola]|uniref:Fatty acid desaturase n=1 Tax=Labilithrix luteola TaxID=1391654 RepID=A0A0K1QEA4_9BACT|nr:acyl-CoA desaturase [Labilithrix luteola]AKV04101.1 Fatty acid desaturase [Labilithrix luteola]
MKKRDYGWLVSLPFYGVHAAAVIGVALVGWSWKWFGLAIALYYVRMFGVTGGYHRYFSHRTYRTSRWFQFILAVLAQSSLQKGALWWAAHHRDHHKYSDTERDPHSFRTRGFWWSHVGWILSRDTEETDPNRIADLWRYPELRWLNKWHIVPGTALAIGLYLVGSWPALVYGFFLSTTLLWHGTFTINSLSHYWGSRRYTTTDDSRNNPVLAIVTMGEGWHNNHHYYQRSVRQGFFWWEIDLTYYVLRTLSVFGIVWDLHLPSESVRAGNAMPAPTPRKRPAAAASDEPVMLPPASASAPALAVSDAE